MEPARQDEPFDSLDPLNTNLRLRQDRNPTGARHLNWVKVVALLNGAATNGGAGNAAFDLLKLSLSATASRIDQRRRDRTSHLSEEDAVAIATSCACLTVGIDDPARLRLRHTSVLRHWQRVRLESWRVALTDRPKQFDMVIVGLKVLPDRLEGSQVLVEAQRPLAR